MTAPKIHVATSGGAGQAVPARTGEGRAERGVVYHTDRGSTQKKMLARLYQVARTAPLSLWDARGCRGHVHGGLPPYAARINGEES
jgi:hypothetical protein